MHVVYSKPFIAGLVPNNVGHISGHHIETRSDKLPLRVHIDFPIDLQTVADTLNLMVVFLTGISCFINSSGKLLLGRLDGYRCDFGCVTNNLRGSSMFSLLMSRNVVLLRTLLCHSLFDQLLHAPGIFFLRTPELSFLLGCQSGSTTGQEKGSPEHGRYDTFAKHR
ncbi:MAG: hypothetical protein D6721_01575 [Gammaproteobacteria bacterium]|nr:MAG: hypothetical protein D6721_01575 [Gammaproteobacteria bacterium]